MNEATSVLVPTTMTGAMELARMMATARLVPSALQGQPADCLLVIEQAMRWQMSPFAAAQECSVIQGKLMYSGKLVAAVVNARGNLAKRLSFDYSGSGEDRTILVSGTLHGETEPRTVDVTLKSAKTANRVWQTQPDQQLMYHGVRVWARRHTPELMLGVYSPEEFDDTPSISRRAAVTAPKQIEQKSLAEELNDEIPYSKYDSADQQGPTSAEAPAPAPHPTQTTPAGAGATFLAMAREVAMQGEGAFQDFYKAASREQKAELRAHKAEIEALYP